MKKITTPVASRIIQELERESRRNEFSKWDCIKERCAGVACAAVVVGTIGLFGSPLAAGLFDYSRSIYRNAAFSAKTDDVKRSGSDRRTMELLSELCYGEKNAQDLLRKLAKLKATGQSSYPDSSLFEKGAHPYFQEAFLSLQTYDHSVVTTLTHLNLSGFAYAAEFGRYDRRAEIIEDLYKTGRLDALMAANTSTGR
jgi:hypothetical protein